jgi:hypothetical protein
MTALGDPLVLLPLSSTDTPGFRVFKNTGALYSVRLWGPLGPLWTGNFTMGLSRLGFDIRRGFARQDRSGPWVAEFLITPTAGATEPGSIDYLGLAADPHPLSEAEPDIHGSAVELNHYALDGSPDQGSTLYLEVRGPDRVGFLGNLLRSLAQVLLFPKEMTIETHAGEVFDRFSLQAVGGRVPSDAARQALAKALDTLVRRRLPVARMLPAEA